MQRIIMLAAIMFVAVISVYAQGKHPDAEIFGGFAFTAVDLIEEGQDGLYGWGASAAGNFNSWFGVAGDFSGNYGKIFGPRSNVQAYTYLLGPRFSARRNVATGFAHVLVGGATARAGGESFTEFTMAVGGGVDINYTKSLAMRFQGDYIPVFVSGVTSHNFRFMTGIVFKLGGK